MAMVTFTVKVIAIATMTVTVTVTMPESVAVGMSGKSPPLSDVKPNANAGGLPPHH
jgi:hypothetical protein